MATILNLINLVFEDTADKQQLALLTAVTKGLSWHCDHLINSGVAPIRLDAHGVSDWHVFVHHTAHLIELTAQRKAPVRGHLWGDRIDMRKQDSGQGSSLGVLLDFVSVLGPDCCQDNPWPLTHTDMQALLITSRYVQWSCSTPTSE